MHTACRIQFQAVVGLRCLFPTGLSSRGHSRKQPCSLVYGLLLSSRSVTADGDLFTSSLCDLPRAPSLLPFLRLYLSDPSRRKFCVCKAHVEEGWQVGKPEVPKQQEGINCKWQTFFFPTRHKIKRLLLILCWGHLVLPELFSNLGVTNAIFLMEMFFLSYVNETVYQLWNLPSFKMVLPKTNFFFFFNLKPGADNGSTNQYSCQLFYDWDDTPWCAILSQNSILWERGLVKPPQSWGVFLIWLTVW